METTREAALTERLFEDARTLRPGDAARWSDPICGILAAYGAMLARAVRTPGYPRLYRMAWLLLVKSVGQGAWETLERVDEIYAALAHGIEYGDDCAHPLSLWHLKAVVYLWAYLRDEREQPAAEDDAVLYPPDGGDAWRTREEAAQLLRSALDARAFFNMSPRDAENRVLLWDAHQDARFARPYLLRLSTTLPSLATLTYVTPRTRRVAHRRLQAASALDLMGDLCVLYEQLAHEASAQCLPTGEYLDARLAVQVLARLEPRQERRHAEWEELVRRAMGEDRVMHRSALVPLLARTFWPRLSSFQLAPEARAELLGLTPSYTESYLSLLPACDDAPLPLHCAECTEPPTVRDELNNQIFCGAGCLAVDRERCY